MTFRNMFHVKWIIWIVVAGSLAPWQAQAQAYICGGGPGPGERQVGFTQAGGGVASMPLCMRENLVAPAPPVSSFASLAWHADASDVWVDGNYLGPVNPSETNAIAMCNKVMGSGCSSVGQWSNSKMVIIRDRWGDFYNAWAGDGGKARKDALAGCSAKQLLPCEVFATRHASTAHRVPGAGVRKTYAASAWMEGADDDNMLYVAGGYNNLDEAKNAAMKACTEARKRPCIINAQTGGGFMQAYRMDVGDSVTSETTAKRAQDAAKKNCSKQKARTCEMQALFDSRKAGLFVHDFGPRKVP